MATEPGSKVPAAGFVVAAIVGAAVGVGDGVGVGDAEPDGVGDGECVGVGDGDGVGVGITWLVVTIAKMYVVPALNVMGGASCAAGNVSVALLPTTGPSTSCQPFVALVGS